MNMAYALQYIPLASLRVSPLNARTIDNKPVDELAASIAADGLLQNLTVTNAGHGMFEVVAGKRRLAALTQLHAEGRLPESLQSPPCLVVNDDRASSASLAENIVRERMHPADEFVAFQRLSTEGRTIDEIAHEFGILPLAVRRHLKLANVAPELFELFRQDKIKLDQMYALALTDDHAKQLAAWDRPESYQREAHAIRAALTTSEIEINKDTAGIFVGLAAIEAAGGVVRKDLFGGDNDGFTTDRELIDSLALEKLESKADAIRAEGWSWVKVMIEFPWQEADKYGRTYATGNGILLSADRQRLDTLTGRMSELQDRDDLDEAEDDEWERLEAEVAEINARKQHWTPEQLATAGAVVHLSTYGGHVEVKRGLMTKSAERAAANAGGGGVSGGVDKPKKADLSESLMRRLTAHRTAILQGALAVQPAVALAVLAHRLMLALFYKGRLDASISTITHPGLQPLEQHASELPLMQHWNTLHSHIAKQQETLPPVTDLFAWLLEQSQETVIALIATCVALSVNTIVGSNQENGERAMMRDVTRALSLDYADHWMASREAFLNYVPRAVIEEAVLEARGAVDVDKLAGLKKEPLIAAAEELLAGKRWLPKALRVAPAKASPVKKPRPKKAAAAAKPAAKKATRKKVMPAKKAASKPAKKAAKP